MMDDHGDTREMRGLAGADIARIVYILYLAGLVLGVTGLIGVVMAYVYRDEGADWVRSHFRFQIRTFWIGLLYIVIGGSTTFLLIGWPIVAFTYVWFIIRCVKGLKFAGRAEPYPDVMTWLW